MKSSNSLDHLDGRISENEDNIFNIEEKVNHAENIIRIHEENFQELWDNMKRPNVRVIRIKEGADLKPK